jgi:hypothetical protein
MSSRAIPVRHNARINIMTIPKQIRKNAIKSAVATIIKADGSIAKAIEAMAAAGFTYTYCSQPQKGCNDPKHKAQYLALMDRPACGPREG